MNQDEAKAEIVDVVSEVQGCKATELIAHERILSLVAEGHKVVEMIAELCDEGELVEVEYVVPNISYRIKSFLLPKGTQISIASRPSRHYSEEPFAETGVVET